MIPVTIEVTNFLPYRDPAKLDFSGIHVACLAGENGAGKSALLEAMVWALWGRARDGKRSDDELIHFGESEMRISFTFDLGNERFQVIRLRKAGKRGQTVLELQMYDTGVQSWRGISESGVRQTQRKINNLLRIDYETFVNSAFIAQGRADAFTVRSPGERKALLANILGLHRWTIYEQQAKECISGLDEDVSLLEHEIGLMDVELKRRHEYEWELDGAEQQLKHVLSQLRASEKQMADVEQARRELANTRRVIDDLMVRIHQAERELTDVEKELDVTRSRGDPEKLAAEYAATESLLLALVEREVEHRKLIEMHSEVVESSARIKGENITLKAEAEPIKARIATLQAATEPVCPTCGEALDDDERVHLLSSLQGDLEARRELYRDNTNRCTELDERAGTLKDQLDVVETDMKGRSKLELRRTELGSAASRATEAQQALGGLEQRLRRWSDTLAQDREKLENAEVEARLLEVQLKQDDTRQQAVDRLRFNHRMATEQVGSVRQKLTSLDGLAQRREVKESSIAKLAEQIGTLEELRMAFGKQGVPAMIIEAAVPEIERTANMLLSRMTSGRMHMRFDTQRELKSGVVAETLDIRIADELGTRNYELYSGGEAFRVNFAIRIALSKLLARRAGAKLQTIVIDEGFGTQDARGRELLIEAINAIQDDFERVLVITHIEELKDAFPTRINVVKTSRGSTLSLS